MNKILTSFFTNTDVPAEGLSPTIRIWELSGTGGTLVVTDDPMVEVGGGFYMYLFTSYDPNKEYLFRADGGALPAGEKFKTGSSDSDNPWDLLTVDHNISGSFGETVNDTSLNVATALSVLDILLKFESNRTRVDPLAKTLTIYQDDGIAVLQVFKLYDEYGSESIETIYERVPQ